jgi:murein L,D-transpeptidase YcbB/YkuD
MGKITAVVLAILWGVLSPSVEAIQACSLSTKVSEEIRAKIPGFAEEKRALLEGAYSPRDYRPFWSAGQGLRPQAAALVQEIRNAHLEGLRPEDYRLGDIETLTAEVNEGPMTAEPVRAERLADLDLLLSDAFLSYGTHLLEGRLGTGASRANWHFESREADLVGLLHKAADTGEVHGVFEGLIPHSNGYAKLKEALARYGRIMKQGGWPVVPDGPKMKEGDRGPRVAALRHRLSATGDAPPAVEGDPEVFDGGLARAVRHFQARHGLDVDGVVGPVTLATLDVPVEERIRQIRLNMERWRWLPDDLGRRYVFINVPSFELAVVEGGGDVMRMRAVVGRKSRPTPLFTSTLKYAQLNPFWHVPPSIARRDILPRIKEDPGYLAREGFKVLENQRSDVEALDPETIDWSEVQGSHFTFRLRQDPGPSNALGRVKFIFPNPFQVFVHDTPAQQLFAKSRRSSSSGCIRIESPIELAEYLLQDNPNWDRQRLLETLESGEMKAVPVSQIPVHIVYFTAWVDVDGTIEFREDIYGRDHPLAAAFGVKPVSVAKEEGRHHKQG